MEGSECFWSEELSPCTNSVSDKPPTSTVHLLGLRLPFCYETLLNLTNLNLKLQELSMEIGATATCG